MAGETEARTVHQQIETFTGILTNYLDMALVGDHGHLDGDVQAELDHLGACLSGAFDETFKAMAQNSNHVANRLAALESRAEAAYLNINDLGARLEGMGARLDKRQAALEGQIVEHTDASTHHRPPVFGGMDLAEGNPVADAVEQDELDRAINLARGVHGPWDNEHIDRARGVDVPGSMDLAEAVEQAAQADELAALDNLIGWHGAAQAAAQPSGYDTLLDDPRQTDPDPEPIADPLGIKIRPESGMFALRVDFWLTDLEVLEIARAIEHRAQDLQATSTKIASLGWPGSEQSAADTARIGRTLNAIAKRLTEEWIRTTEPT